MNTLKAIRPNYRALRHRRSLARSVMESLSCHARAHVAIKGRITPIVRHADGSETVYDDTYNMVVNQGLDAMGGSFPTNYGNSWAAAVSVGTGNTTPTAADTTLTAGLAFTATQNPGWAGSSVATAPYNSIFTSTYQFAVGAVVGNIAEVGLLLGRTSGSQTATDRISTHALIQVGGSPGTITLTATDQLLVVYQFTFIYTADTTGSIIVTTDGTPSGSNNFTVRPYNLGNYNPSQGFNPFVPVDLANNSPNRQFYRSTGTTLAAASALNLNGTNSVCNFYNRGTYTAGTYSITFNAHFNTGTAFNDLLYGAQMTMMGFQMLFTTAFGPTSAQTMDFAFGMSWANAS